MDSRRFDSLAQRLALRGSRRTAFKGVTALAATGMLATRGVAAQEATPITSGTPTAPELAPGHAENNSTLFVQTAASGTFEPNPRAASATRSGVGSGTPTGAQPGTYLLTLHGHNGETIAFSDRPERKFGEAPTPRFLQIMGFTSVDPPNAALVVDTPEQEGAVILLELLNPTYDSSTQVLIYEAELLQTYPNDRGSSLTPIAGTAQQIMPPASFSSASLFIDDCPDGDIACTNNNDGQSSWYWSSAGFCYNALSVCCSPCDGQAYWTAQCNTYDPGWCDGNCSATWSEDDQC